MLSSLVKQISARRPYIPQSVKDLSKYRHAGERLDMEALEAALADTLRGFSAVYIVVDALDECPVAGGERQMLLQTLRRIVTTVAIAENLHLFCTSRREADIDAAMGPLCHNTSRVELDLLVYYGDVESDIGRYIDSSLARDGFASWSDEMKAEARELLAKKADGMYVAVPREV